MATISEIARAADVPIESVLRVLNREPVSSDVAARVHEAMDRYGFGRLRPPQDADHDESPAPEQHVTPKPVTGEIVAQSPHGDVDPADDLGRAREQLLHAVGDVVRELESPGAAGERSQDPELRALAERTTIMDALLHRLAQDVEGMKRELGRARSERLEDLTLLVDLITTSWRAVDRRLGRIDRKLERLEGAPEEHAPRRLRAGERARLNP